MEFELYRREILMLSVRTPSSLRVRGGGIRSRLALFPILNSGTVDIMKMHHIYAVGLTAMQTMSGTLTPPFYLQSGETVVWRHQTKNRISLDFFGTPKNYHRPIIEGFEPSPQQRRGEGGTGQHTSFFKTFPLGSY